MVYLDFTKRTILKSYIHISCVKARLVSILSRFFNNLK